MNKKYEGKITLNGISYDVRVIDSVEPKRQIKVNGEWMDNSDFIKYLSYNEMDTEMFDLAKAGIEKLKGNNQPTKIITERHQSRNN